MDVVLFEERVTEMDRKFAAEGRKIALIIDYCPAHPEIENLKAIKLFSSHRTQLLWLMDQGVIRSLKAIYRKNVFRRCSSNESSPNSPENEYIDYNQFI